MADATTPQPLARAWTPTRNQRAFLAAYRQLGTVLHAAAAAQVDRHQHYDWLADAGYAAAYADARETFADALERAAYRRAVEGVLEPRTVAGEAVTVRVYSDRLLELLLRAKRPAEYRERIEHTGAGGAPLVIQAVMYDRPAALDAAGLARRSP